MVKSKNNSIAISHKDRILNLLKSEALTSKELAIKTSLNNQDTRTYLLRLKKENKIKIIDKKGRYNVYSHKLSSNLGENSKRFNELEYELSFLNNLIQMKLDIKEGEVLSPTDLSMLKKIQNRIDERKSLLGDRLKSDNKLEILKRYLPDLEILQKQETVLMKREPEAEIITHKNRITKDLKYIFKILILGDYNTIQTYISQAFGEPGENKGNYIEWYKEIKVLEDYCDLEINAITSLDADLDEIIPITDGIIYFLNPLKKEEFEIFELILPIISSLKQEIPTIILFYDQSGILPISANDLLESIWINYPNSEAFVNLSPREFYQTLHSLSLAMINGEAPLNIDNAWMRYPLFVQMANIHFNNGNYYLAAQALRKVALIAQIYNKEEYLIASEQAAYLYSKINLYLEASKILEEIDRRKSLDFKKLHAESLIREGNLYFNKGEYQAAAIQYEKAGQWASIELLDDRIIDEAFRLAIISWISVGQIENAFQILDSLDRGKKIVILNEMVEKIGATVEYLMRNGKYIQAQEQLNLAITYYKREELATLLTKFKPIVKKN